MIILKIFRAINSITKFVIFRIIFVKVKQPNLLPLEPFFARVKQPNLLSLEPFLL